jgi:hypothetical protein
MYEHVANCEHNVDGTCECAGLQLVKHGLIDLSDKVKLSLCLINYTLCHEDIWRSGGIAPLQLTSALDGGE